MLLRSLALLVAGASLLLPTSGQAAPGGFNDVPAAATPKPKPSASAKKDWVFGEAPPGPSRPAPTKTPGSSGEQTSQRPGEPSNRCIPGIDPECEGPVAPGQARQASTPTDDDARGVVARLHLPDPTPRFGPDPSVNEWNMLAVGFPIWLWTDQPTHLTTTARNGGMTFDLTATWTSTTFTMGDGHSKTCTTTTAYPPHIDKPGRPSPTCGYVYSEVSPVGHPYTVSAETHWRIDWSSSGERGSFDHAITGSRSLDVGELQSLVNG